MCFVNTFPPVQNFPDTVPRLAAQNFLSTLQKMKAHWIVENFTDSEDYRDLVRALRDLGRECFIIGRHNHFDFDPSGFIENECVIVQGSIQMTKNIASRLPKGCFPIAYNSWDNFLCSAYYPKLRPFLFNDRNIFTTLAKLKEERSSFYEKFGRQEVIFVRPDSGEKSFSGQLLELGDFDRFWSNAMGSSAKDDDIIVVSTPKNIKGEWRFLCSKYNGGEIITFSSYQVDGKRIHMPVVPEGARSACQAVLNEKYFPDSLFCVDICQDSDGNYWLLELTSFSSAGLYAMQKDILAKRVSEIAEFEYRGHFKISNVGGG